MGNLKLSYLLMLFFNFFLAAQGSRRAQVIILAFQPGLPRSIPWHLQGSNEPKMSRRNPTRLMIGSTVPTCTYNECRGCKYKCSAEQVPVEGNDPINSAYHYKCVCHRS